MIIYVELKASKNVVSYHLIYITQNIQTKSCSSAGKESGYNAGDPGSIPGSGRSPGEGTGYPLQYSWASLVAQLVKNPPEMQETWAQSLGWEDPLEKATTTCSSILAWRIPRSIFHGTICIFTNYSMVAKSQSQLSDFHFHFQTLFIVHQAG